MSNEYTSLVPTINPDGRFMIETTVIIPATHIDKNYVVDVVAIEDNCGLRVEIVNITAKSYDNTSDVQIFPYKEGVWYLHTTNRVSRLIDQIYKNEIVERFYEERDLAIEEVR